MPTWATTVHNFVNGELLTDTVLDAEVSAPITEIRTYVSPSAWQNITIDPDFSAGGGGAKCRLEGERVFLMGTIVRNTGTFVANEAVGTLPVGYRPVQAQTLTVAPSNTPGTFRLDISTAGVMTIFVASGSGVTVFLDGVNFSTT